ncbi:hypothetical protein L209DRAFT_115393 [Thermothelomyces heterothallicus CBS 203.75]
MINYVFDFTIHQRNNNYACNQLLIIIKHCTGLAHSWPRHRTTWDVTHYQRLQLIN